MHTKRLTLVLVFVGLIGCSNDSSEFESLLKKEQQSQVSAADRPKDLDEQLALVKRELEIGTSRNALKMSRSLLLQHPSNEDVLLLAAEAQAADGDKIGAAQTLQSISSGNIDQRALWSVKASKWLVESGEYTLAIDALRPFVAEHPDQTRVRRQLAVLLNQSGLRLEAAEHMRWILRMKGLSERELFGLVSLRRALIDATLAAPKVASLDPVMLSRAMKFHDDGQLDEALQLAESLSEEHPGNATIVAFTGRLLSEAELEERFLEWRAGLSIDLSQQPDYWYSVGLSEYRQERYRESVRCFGECLLLDQTDRDAAIHFARALKFVGNVIASEKALQRYRRLDRVARLASGFGLAKGSYDEYLEMASELDALGRGWEAHRWRSIALSVGAVNDERAKGKLNADRKRLIDEVFDPSLAICGLDLSEMPLPLTPKNGFSGPSSKSSGPTQPSDTEPDLDIRLTNIAPGLGINFQYVNGDDPSDNQFFLHEQTGGGFGAIDFDLDGWPDLYCAQAGGSIPNHNDSLPDQLYRNLAGAECRQVTLGADIENLGYGQGVDVADLNQDGFPDVLVANIGINVTWMNNGDGTFSKAELPSEGDGMWTTSIASGDLDGDHLPEIIEVNYIDDSTAFEIACVPENDQCGPSRFRPAVDRWLSVNSDGRITRWRGEPDQSENTGHGFAAIITSIDQEEGNDVYVANDSDSNWFWKNASAGQRPAHRGVDFSALIEAGQLAGCGAGGLGGHHGSMGLAAADWDRDGALDLHVTNFWEQESDFYLQVQDGVFQHAAQKWQIEEVTEPTVGWGTQAIDLNQDGLDDMVVLNGHIVDRSQSGVPFQMRPQFFVNSGNQWLAATDNLASGSYLSRPALGRALCRIDIDRDGRSDLVAGHLNRPLAILRNETLARNWVRFTLIGVESEREAIGARVEVQFGQRTLVGWRIGGGGFLCDNEAVVEFGLGDCEILSRVEVTWPSGQRQRFENVKSSQHYQVVEGETHMQVDSQ